MLNENVSCKNLKIQAYAQGLQWFSSSANKKNWNNCLISAELTLGLDQNLIAQQQQGHNSKQEYIREEEYDALIFLSLSRRNDYFPEFLHFGSKTKTKIKKTWEGCRRVSTKIRIHINIIIKGHIRLLVCALGSK